MIPIRNIYYMLSYAFQVLNEQGYKDVDGKMYPNLRHEILNEDEKDKVYEDILNFIK